MNTATELELINLKLAQAEITNAGITEDELTVHLADGRTISVPILWFPRLAYATPAERENFEIERRGIHWPDLDEDVSIRTLLLGRGLGESRESLEQWLQRRQQVKLATAPRRPNNGDDRREQRVVTR
ncbi:DUF2442 domain-containing protein [Candidatus Amarolinea dominans]|jgi:hypothetical protein|uniref:DUF2442 domain-containing protein n=1 Tax=Candidatus Amarolinea dominans TaxID=3140696 RepID=UPI001D517C5B|nr:DUF2442 domain-containing protein [Anaerolineae bacterium]MBK7203998.1 DUF2442 domain-containing protein [Anaerolineae bacterium]MBK9092194.1 DUF2442 domain-containing protein [Anaerolineae bacterium]MBK9229518.1 DUF2442 domain-containing protein [Anaerolineae bacterium]